jgi:cytochrome c peroxidase
VGRRVVLRKSPYCLLALLLGSAALAATGLPPVPAPPENPITEAKRVLGKILFWDEQLSSDNTVACGSCHRPSAGGADPRRGIHPGSNPGTIDNVTGSPGIAKLDSRGQPEPHVIFGNEKQITPRASPNFFATLWADELFWDGRAGSRFLNPETGEVAIEHGGALENQALTALSSDTEMAKHGRTWNELTTTLDRVEPLALATDWPSDVELALRRAPTYGALFADAFGDARITPVRIAFSIASYERTLVSDQTDWDRFQNGEPDAMTQTEIYGWQAFQSFNCSKCHEPPLFTNNQFFNIGLRRTEYDPGRQGVSGAAEDAGEFKVPSLRNAALKPTFMHTGEFEALGAAVGFYRTGPALPDRDDIPGVGIYAFNMSPLTEADIVEFLHGGLVDSRVAAETFPFDRPTLQSERTALAAEFTSQPP